MGRKASKDPKEWLAYQHRLISAAATLPATYMEELREMLPGKSLNRIKNARAGLVQDEDVLEALERISNREKGRRAALLQTA